MTDPNFIGRILADLMSDPPKGHEEPAREETTDDALRAMLVENTGAHVLDSGGAYGRAWQRNRESHPADGPDAWLEAYPPYHGEGTVDCYPIVSLYHFFVERVEYDPERTRAFWAWCEETGSDPAGNYGAEAWIEDSLGRKVIASGYTYNEENLLSQDFTFVVWTDDDDEYSDDVFVVISIHNGADARGGFTDGRVFRVCESGAGSWYGMADWADAEIYCDGEPGIRGQLHLDGSEADAFCGAHWSVRGGDREGYYRDGYEAPDLSDYPCRAAESDDDTGEIGTVVVIDHRTATCPVCGVGKLRAAPPHAS